MGPFEASVGTAARVLGPSRLRRLCTALCTTSHYSYSYEFGKLATCPTGLPSPDPFVMLIFIS
eukprot:scaffold548194_cov18-Prasinocladus_malaysianus.AAC.1